MTYDFALDKKALIFLLAGSVAIGVLLFLAGWIVGSQWPLGASPAVASTTAENESAAVPKEPVLEEAPAPPSSDAPKSAKPKLPNQAAEAPTEQSAAAGKIAPPRIISEAATEDAAVDASAVNDEQEVVETDYVTVQVGVFLDEKEASHLLQQMERKGYAPTFFSGRDAEARQWYAVRIGVYSDREQATNAAANFTRHEKVKATVRPMGSL